MLSNVLAQSIALLIEVHQHGGEDAVAAINLVKKLGGDIVGFAAVVNLPDIGGSKKIAETGVAVYAQTEFEGD